AQTRPAFSSNGSARPANSACRPSGPENQRSYSLRFFPAGFSRIPRRISATVSEEINNSSSACSAIHATRPSDGTGLVTLLIILVSRRLRLTGQHCGPAKTCLQFFRSERVPLDMEDVCHHPTQIRK